MEHAEKFNAIIKKLVYILQCKCTTKEESALVGRLKSRISLLINMMGKEALIAEAAPHLRMYSEKILNKDVDFFQTIPVAELLKNKSNDFATSLVNSIRISYANSTEKEQDEIYALVLDLLAESTMYEMAITK